MLKALPALAGLLFVVLSGKVLAQGEPVGTNARNLTIRLDFESAKAIINLLGQGSVTDKALDEVALLYGNQQLIRKVATYDKSGTEERFKQTLREIIETGTVQGNDAFNWKAVKAQQAAVRTLIRQIEPKQAAFLREISEEIAPYSPANLKADIRACFLVGGGSLGFTIGNDNTFNVALQKIGDDYEGLIKLVAHELYHSVQQAGQQVREKAKPPGTTAKPPRNMIGASVLLESLWSEGTANVVGDFTKIKQPKAFTKIQQDEYALNRQRNQVNFVLFESLLYRAYHDSTAHVGDLYNVGFTVAYDEPAYFVGYEMTKYIEKHEGRAAIASLINQSPVAFAQRYVSLYKKQGGKDVLKFSAPIEAILDTLASWKEKL